MSRSLIIITILIEIMFWVEIERALNQSSETLVPGTANMPVDIIGTRQTLQKAEKRRATGINTWPHLVEMKLAPTVSQLELASNGS